MHLKISQSRSACKCPTDIRNTLVSTEQPVSLKAIVGLSLCHTFTTFNPLPNEKILDQSKFKIFADDKMNVTKQLKFVLGRVEYNVGKEENAGYQHLLLFPQCFQKASP